MTEDISRDVAKNIGPNGEDIRLYEYNGNNLPSVTSVLKTRDDDKSGLYAWQDDNDGEGDNAFHQHLFWFSRHIGTLGHWYALHELDEFLDWTEDEAESAWVLQNIDQLTHKNDTIRVYDERLGRHFHVHGDDHEEILNATPRDVLYSILKERHGVETWGEFYGHYEPYNNHDYYSNGVYERAIADVEYFVDAQTRLWNKLGLDTDSVIAVEQYLFNDVDGYAGQVDLVYEDPDGYTVVADLKSSSGCYTKHQMQGAAYGRSAEVLLDDVDSVDRLEVHRASPKKGEMAVHTHRDAVGKQPIHTTKYWNDGYQSLWEDFERLLDAFELNDGGE